MRRLGVDVGGTFTDLILVDEDSGRITVDKVPSTPDDPARGSAEGIRALCARGSVQLEASPSGSFCKVTMTVEMGRAMPTAASRGRVF